jgi:hypothetical protein
MTTDSIRQTSLAMFLAEDGCMRTQGCVEEKAFRLTRLQLVASLRKRADLGGNY